MTDTPLPGSAARVAATARTLGLDVHVREMPGSTRTSEEAAAACGCSVAQIAKSLVFRGRVSKTPFLLLVSGINRVDEKGAVATIGEALKRTDADDVRALTGFAIGGIPPFGHATPLVTFMDEDLFLHERIWAAAGTPFAVFETTPRDLAAATGAKVIRVKATGL